MKTCPTAFQSAHFVTTSQHVLQRVVAPCQPCHYAMQGPVVRHSHTYPA